MTDGFEHDHKPDTDGRLAAAVRLLRVPVETDAQAFDARVLKQLQQPRGYAITTRVSIVVAALAAAILMGVGLHNISRSIVPRATQTVRFQLAGVHATSVAVAGSFNGWNAEATPLHRAPNGTWTAEVALTPGRHVYQFVIDRSRWVPDPRSPRDPGDDFGTQNSVITVLPHRSGS
jgi:hypothetical protein